MGVTERLLAPQHGGVIRPGHVRRGGQRFERNQVGPQPLLIRVGGGVSLLQFLIVDDATLGRVHQEHAAGMQPFLDEHVLRRDIEHADLGGHHHQIVLGHVIARRAQAVAVEHGADHAAVGEGDRGRAVPRLHQATVVFVEGLARLVHGLMPAPGLGDHHQHRVRQLAPGHVQKLEHVVEGGRVAAVFHDDRQEFFQVVAEHGRLAQRLARAHPVDVAAQCVDLAVVGDEAERMRQRPGRKGVGREARMHQRQRRRHRRVVQFREKFLDLVRRQHALVDDRARRQAGHVELVLLDERAVGDGVLNAFANDEQFALEGGLILYRRRARDEGLFENRLRGLGGWADGRIVDRHPAPTKQRLPLFAHDGLELLLAGSRLAFLARQEHQTAAVVASVRQGHAQGLRFAHIKAVRQLQQDAGAVAGVLFAAAGAAVLQVLEDAQGIGDNAVRGNALHVHHETDAAGVVLGVGRVQAAARVRFVFAHGYPVTRYPPAGQPAGGVRAVRNRRKTRDGAQKGRKVYRRTADRSTQPMA